MPPRRLNEGAATSAVQIASQNVPAGTSASKSGLVGDLEQRSGDLGALLAHRDVIEGCLVPLRIELAAGQTFQV